jgi:hypothetical protein
VAVFVARMPCALVARVSSVPHSQDIDGRTTISVARGRSQCLMRILARLSIPTGGRPSHVLIERCDGASWARVSSRHDHVE